ncbi:hypothetical protein WG66_013498, partial [Moniliophthora roreri]
MSVLQKYAESHRQLYPGSDIVVVQSHMHFFWSSDIEKKKTLAPVADYVLSRVYTRGLNTSGRGMIVHTFSNGMCTFNFNEMAKVARLRFPRLQLLTLSELLVSRLKDIEASLQNLQYHRCVPIALIFDSLPRRVKRPGMRSIEVASS